MVAYPEQVLLQPDTLDSDAPATGPGFTRPTGAHAVINLTTIDRFMAKVFPEPMSGCWIWDAGVGRDGYGRFSWEARGEAKAHRAAYLLFKSKIPPGMHVLHKCDVPCCVNPEHLFLGNHRINMTDMVDKGRAKRCGIPGEEHHHSKLTNEIVREIKASTCSQDTTAKKYGISQSAVSRLKSGKSWGHLEEGPTS